MVLNEMTPRGWWWVEEDKGQGSTRGAAAGVKLMGMHACALPVAEQNVLRKHCRQ